MAKRKVKILETSYTIETDLIKWKIRYLDNNEEVTLAWLSSDLGVALGIKGDIPKELIPDFCEKMKGKEIYLDNIAVEEPPDIDSFKKHDPSSMQQECDNLDKYPYHEVLKEMQGEYENFNPFMSSLEMLKYFGMLDIKEDEN